MASVSIKNPKQLTDIVLEKYVASALKSTQQVIYDVIQESINEYYKEYSPEFYSRTYKFLKSLIKTDVIRRGNTIQCEVKINESYLKYNYPNQGFSKSLPATGTDVVRWANRDERGFGNHGGTVDEGRDEGFWDIGLRDLGGKRGIMELLISNLKRRGLNIK